MSKQGLSSYAVLLLPSLLSSAINQVLLCLQNRPQIIDRYFWVSQPLHARFSMNGYNLGQNCWDPLPKLPLIGVAKLFLSPLQCCDVVKTNSGELQPYEATLNRGGGRGGLSILYSRASQDICKHWVISVGLNWFRPRL